MRNEFYIFTDHALDRCTQQKLSKTSAIKLLKNGTSENHKADTRGAFYIRNGSWIFTCQQVSYNPIKGAIVRVITATNQVTTSKSYVTQSYRQYEIGGLPKLPH